MEFYIAQGISVLTTLLSIFTMQLKSMKKILIGQTLVNLLVAVSYFLLGGLSGAGICFIAIFQGIIMYFYNTKGTKPHLWVILGFIALYITCSVLYYKDYTDLFPAVAAVCFALSIVQQKPDASRLWYLPNPLLWIIYDIILMAYGNLIMHIIVFVGTLLGIIRLDLKKKK